MCAEYVIVNLRIASTTTCCWHDSVYTIGALRPRYPHFIVHECAAFCSSPTDAGVHQCACIIRVCQQCMAPLGSPAHIRASMRRHAPICWRASAALSGETFGMVGPGVWVPAAHIRVAHADESQTTSHRYEGNPTAGFDPTALWTRA